MPAPPSLRELMAACGLASLSHVWHIVGKLVACGLVERSSTRYSPRTLVVVRGVAGLRPVMRAETEATP